MLIAGSEAISVWSLSQGSAGDHSRRAGCPKDPFFFREGVLSGLDYGLVSWRQACYRLIRLFLIPVGSPREKRERSRSGNRGLGFEIRADNARFCCRGIY
jgi:hypothetical protein